FQAVFAIDGNTVASSKCGDEPLTVIKATPTITTSASPAASQVVGTTFTTSDTATFHNTFSPTGSVSFTLYNSDCSVSTGVSGSGTISGNTATFSASFTPTATGTYQWLASYAGDANNTGFTTTLSLHDALPILIKATPTITTSASPAASQVV